jgi:DegV family protein with EDD domain
MIHVVTDTTAGLPPEVAQRYSISILPQLIVFGKDSFREGIEIDNAGFMQRLLSSRELPKTAAPPPEWFVEEFRRILQPGDTVFCIHPSAEVSGTVRSAEVAALEFPDADIRVIDTRTIGSPLATLVQLAAEWAAAGEPAATIEARLRDLIARGRIYFLVPTLEYLARGGRIGGASALLGSVLQLKPILTFRQGRVESHARVRTQKRALAFLKDEVVTQCPSSADAYLSVMHGSAPTEAQSLADDLRGRLGLPADVATPILDVPPAIVTHAGPGVLAVGFFVGD